MQEGWPCTPDSTETNTAQGQNGQGPLVGETAIGNANGSLLRINTISHTFHTPVTQGTCLCKVPCLAKGLLTTNRTTECVVRTENDASKRTRVTDKYRQTGTREDRGFVKERHTTHASGLGSVLDY